MFSSERQTVWHVVLIAASVVAPFGAILLSRFVSQYDVAAQIFSTRTVCGVIVGQLIGLRRGNIQSFILGPVFGLAAGVIDLELFAWMVDAGGVSISTAGLVPAWGAIIGALVASYCGRWYRRVIVWVVIMVSDLFLRWAWDQSFQLCGVDPAARWIWLTEAIVYIPTALLAVALSMRDRGLT